MGEELVQISFIIPEQLLKVLSTHFQSKKEYIIPKVDVCIDICNEHQKILLVKKVDGNWLLLGRHWLVINRISLKRSIEKTGLLLKIPITG